MPVHRLGRTAEIQINSRRAELFRDRGVFREPIQGCRRAAEQKREHQPPFARRSRAPDSNVEKHEPAATRSVTRTNSVTARSMPPVAVKRSRTIQSTTPSIGAMEMNGFTRAPWRKSIEFRFFYRLNRQSLAAFQKSHFRQFFCFADFFERNQPGKFLPEFHGDTGPNRFFACCFGIVVLGFLIERRLGRERRAY